MISIKTFNQNLAQINSYCLRKQSHIVVIDPGFNGDAIMKFVSEKELTIDAVLLTHGHFDHIKDIELLAKHQSFDLYISVPDKSLLYHDNQNYASAFNSSFHLPNNLVVKMIKDNETIHLLNEPFLCFYTPGHTKGSICIQYQNRLFSGDTLFADSIGRTDLYSGNMSDMKQSLRLLSERLSNQTIVYPGHGESKKWQEIKEVNPYLK